jgi:hypothetical protein
MANRCDLYHSALQVFLPEGSFVIEQAPSWRDGAEPGVVAEGPFGARAVLPSCWASSSF